MNRSFALLLASAILVAHMLALHGDALGNFAPPYEVAHVAFRMARNLVASGRFAWDPGGAPIEGYPSIAWVLIAAVPESLGLSTPIFMQVVSAVCALATSWVLARFSPVRLAGVIAPVLFVASGAVASAAASGTEMSLAALLVTAALLAYEHERPRALAQYLSLLCLARPEGAPLAAVLLLIELVRRKRGAGAPARRAMLGAFVAPAVVIALTCLVRLALTGTLLSPWMRATLEPEHLHPLAALLYLRDFFVGSGAGLLIVFPLWYLLRGGLSGLGVRALILTLAWCVLAALGGDGPQKLPFCQFMVPILAVLLVAVQEAMTQALDSKRAWLPRLTWVLFVLGLVVSILSSKFPGNLGPLPVRGLHEAWMRARAPRPLGQSDRLGRESLLEEIRLTGRLLELGAFLRDNLDPELSVLSPWPGAIGYRSSLRVVDALSRVTRAPGSGRVQPWGSLGAWDIVGVLEERPAYIVPGRGPESGPPSVEAIAELWIDGLDRETSTADRNAKLEQLLREYELITVPALAESAGSEGDSRFYLLRRRDLHASPTLSLRLEGRGLVVEVRHGSHQQLVDLLVEVVDAEGEVWRLSPTGEPGERDDLRARSSILLFPTGARPIALMRTALPAGLDVRSARSVLLNPGAASSDEAVCPAVALDL